jgi:hypothetical protein
MEFMPNTKRILDIWPNNNINPCEMDSGAGKLLFERQNNPSGNCGFLFGCLSSIIVLVYFRFFQPLLVLSPISKLNNFPIRSWHLFIVGHKTN